MCMKHTQSSLIFLAALAFWSLLSGQALRAQQPMNNPSEKLDALLFYLENYYVETVEKDPLIEAALNGVLKELDPHSYYLSLKELQASEEALSGNFEGIGIQFNILNDTIMVVSPISGGPSEKLGIRSGDKIVTINDTVVAGTGITNKDVFKWLRGKKGSIVRVGIKRAGQKALIDFHIVRDKIPVFSLDASYLAAPGIGYIKLNRFGEKTPQEFEDAWINLKEQGAQNLILDLQGNSGGYLGAAVALADEFLTSEQLVVYTEGIHSARRDYRASEKGNLDHGKLVVLIDEGSASASEIVAGAIQDWDRGLVVGRRSFGKGLVQNTFPLPDGSALRLTTARYYTPSGRFIQSPYDKGTDAYYEDLAHRFEEGELTDSAMIHFPDSLTFKTEAGRKVYGGGGILPDVFVPLDTTFFSPFLNRVNGTGLSYQTTMEYIDRNRSELIKDYPDLATFKLSFDAEELLQKVVQKAKEKEIEIPKEDLEKSKDWLKTALKAMTAQALFDRNAYFEIMQSQNETLKKAIDLLQGAWPKHIKS